MNSRSIRFKLISWYTGFLVVLFLIVGSSGYFGLKYYLVKLTQVGLTKRARLLASKLQIDLVQQHDQNQIVEDIQKYYAPETNDWFLRVTRDDGSIYYVSGIPKDGSFDPNQVAPLSVLTDQASLRLENTSSGDELYIYTLPFHLQDGKRFEVEAGVSSERINAALTGLLFTLVIGLPIIVLVAIAGGYFLIGRALVPVDKMTQTAERITSRNLSERLPVTPTGDEIERLSLSLNSMIGRLEEAFQHISRFSADASHELRTPLTILHCELETVIQKPKMDLELRERIGSALGETERLAKIVEGLLAISRLDAGEARIEKLPLDLSKLVAATVDQMRLLAEDKNIQLHCDVHKNIQVAGDISRLKQIVVNLLDNAIKYTPEDGTIRVNVFTNDQSAILEVSDTGIGITEPAITHVFERFYRTDRARSRQQGGAGLGLSIVKSICTAHGGQVTVQSVEGQGSTFRVELPLLSTKDADLPIATNDELPQTSEKNAELIRNF